MQDFWDDMMLPLQSGCARTRRECMTTGVCAMKRTDGAARHVSGFDDRWGWEEDDEPDLVATPKAVPKGGRGTPTPSSSSFSSSRTVTVEARVLSPMAGKDRGKAAADGCGLRDRQQYARCKGGRWRDGGGDARVSIGGGRGGG